ncbi:MAG TPA: baseplate J/gp47 family protein [Candidatus Limnocylindrales bacterium]
MAVCYLESDDEITTAIGRLRAVTDGEAIVVVPAGSRIATSRINFKLLAREGLERRMNVAAVSEDPQVRALAISAGLPAYDSIRTAEQALATFRDQDRRLAERIRPTMPREHPDASLRDAGATRVMPASAPPTARPDRAMSGDTAVLPASAAMGAGAPTAAAARSARRARPRRHARTAPVLVLVLLVLLVIGVGYGAYVFLPTASITVRPLAAPIQAPPFTVTADPNVAVVDTVNGVIPAQALTVPVQVSGTFSATGIQTRDIRAAGSVQFKSENTLNAVPIPADTVVATSDGIQFATQQAVTIGTASFANGPTLLDVDVKAVKGGTAGNVDVGTITVVPANLATQLISVTNPGAMTGGKHVQTQVVSQDDYDSAVATLTAQLQAALLAALADPASVPHGLVAYPATAQLGAAQPDQDAATLVGVDEATFALALDTSARVVAVNESPINAVAQARLRAMLKPGQKLVSDVTATNDGGSVVGQTIVYGVVASGVGYVDPDPQAILAAVRGKSPADARAALAQYGQADLSLWPDFIDHLPDQSARISVTVIAPSAPPLPSAPPPTAPPLPTARPLPTRAPSPTPAQVQPTPSVSVGPAAT